MKIAEVLFELRNDIGIILHAADPQPVMQLSSNMGIARNIRPKTIRSGEMPAIVAPATLLVFLGLRA